MPSLDSVELNLNEGKICKDFRVVLPGFRCRPPPSAEGKEKESELVKAKV